MGSVAQLKYIYTNACSMGNKQEELEAIVQQENYDIVAIMETWWDDSHNGSAAMDGYKLFRRDRQGRRGSGVALYVRECFDCLELNDGDDRVECLWVRIRGKANKADIMVGVCYRPPNQDEEAPLDLLLMKRKGHVVHVVVGGCLGHSDHEMIEFLILREVRRGVSRTATLDFWRADFGLFRGLVERVPWETVLKGKGVQEGWTFFKKEILKPQEQAVPMCRKMSRWGRGLAWLNRELWLELRKKKESLWPLEEGAGNSRELQGCCEVMQGEN
ncbi:hypothetical protein GRJ2_003116900 [Grus japonensis]|uniref:Endonuclease/exonuclease/phosphatase domain-containing protein n=1 Tax=Grus japonensis TaxID=30415 RepID=A0ABC9Y8X3_GRUJA